MRFDITALFSLMGSPCSPEIPANVIELTIKSSKQAFTSDLLDLVSLQIPGI